MDPSAIAGRKRNRLVALVASVALAASAGAGIALVTSGDYGQEAGRTWAMPKEKTASLTAATASTVGRSWT